MALSSKTTIAKNTLLLYGRTLVLLVVSLFTSRVVLQSLGVEDWGTYTAVAGVVTMLNMITGPLAGAISRFLTVALGQGDIVYLRRVFSCSMTIQYIFILVAVVIIEIVGVWFVNFKMVIPEGRLSAANWVLQMALLSFVMGLIATPYNSAIIAHERMKAFAYISIVDVFFRLGIAYLVFIVGNDKLIAYAVLMAIASILIRLIYLVYCKRSFEECRNYKLMVNKALFKDMFSFAGWSLFGGAASVIHIQGTSILLNLFGGPLVNAAQGIANQINSAISNFVNNFTTAINPSIIKSYAIGNTNYMLSLIYQGSRFSFYLLLFFAVPLLVETEYIISLWLGQCPDHTISFVRLIIINTMIDCLSKPIITGVNANGNIRNYQIIVGGLLIFNLPISYLALKLGAPVEITAIISIFISVFALVARVLISKSLIGISFSGFAYRVVLVVSVVFVLSILPPLMLHHYLPHSTLCFIAVIALGLLSCGISSFCIGCNKEERLIIMGKIMGFIKSKKA